MLLQSEQLPFGRFLAGRVHVLSDRAASRMGGYGRVKVVKAFLGTPVSKTQLLQSLVAHRESYSLSPDVFDYYKEGRLRLRDRMLLAGLRARERMGRGPIRATVRDTVRPRQ